MLVTSGSTLNFSHSCFHAWLIQNFISDECKKKPPPPPSVHVVAGVNAGNTVWMSSDMKFANIVTMLSCLTLTCILKRWLYKKALKIVSAQVGLIVILKRNVC